MWGGGACCYASVRAVTPVCMQVGARGAGLVLCVLQEPHAGELPADRVTSLAHNLTLDPR